MNSESIMMIFLLYFLLLTLSLSETQNDCSPVKCGVAGPEVRFPFRLENLQPDRCGYPGFDLSCTGDNRTEFHFQFPLQATPDNIVIHETTTTASIKSIDYKSQTLKLSAFTPFCLPKRPPATPSPPSKFTVLEPYPNSPRGYTLFNCSSNRAQPLYSSGEISCLSGNGFKVHALRSSYSVSEVPLGCTMMYNISDAPDELLFGKQMYNGGEVDLHWSEPDCTVCEADGMFCQLKYEGKNGDIQCISMQEKKKGISKKTVAVAVSVAGVFLLVLIIAAVLYEIRRVKTMRSDKEENISLSKTIKL